MWQKECREFWTKLHGQASIELALTMPALLLLATGVFSFGVTLLNYSTLCDATGVASRQLAVSRGQTTDPCQSGSNAVIQAAPNLDPNKMTFSTDIFDGFTHYIYPGTSCSGPNTYSGPPGNLLAQGTVRLTVTYPCSLWRYGNPGKCGLTASTLEVIQ